ncbi:MAG: F0F1 ATP synthase subunit epsilon [Desulfobulbaceae bacterium]|nr:F0F1 ATP synthase subunit epsilon [Desulfobulbaceae bacterium]
MATINLEVVTPTGPVISTDVDIVTAPGHGGEFGVLANHAPFLSTIKTGTLSFKRDREVKYLMVSGGFAEVSNNKITFLVESAEYGYDVDVDRAISAKERALKRIAQAQQKGEQINLTRAEAALQRALARIQAAENSRQG